MPKHVSNNAELLLYAKNCLKIYKKYILNECRSYIRPYSSQIVFFTAGEKKDLISHPAPEKFVIETVYFMYHEIEFFTGKTLHIVLY